MTSDIIYHYVYRITNLVENKHYYGKRSSKIEPKLDLGKKYFSSSKDKDFVSSQKLNPQNYKYKIVAKFITVDEALCREIKLHNKFDVGISHNFYNRSKQTSNKFIFDSTGIIRPKEVGEKISKALSGRKHTAEHRRKHSESMRNSGNTNKGIPMSEEQKIKISEALKGKKHTSEHTANVAAAKLKSGKTNKGVPMTEEQKEKISKAHKGKKHTPEQIAKYSITRKANNKIRAEQKLKETRGV